MVKRMLSDDDQLYLFGGGKMFADGSVMYADMSADWRLRIGDVTVRMSGSSEDTHYLVEWPEGFQRILWKWPFSVVSQMVEKVSQPDAVVERYSVAGEYYGRHDPHSKASRLRSCGFSVRSKAGEDLGVDLRLRSVYSHPTR